MRREGTDRQGQLFVLFEFTRVNTRHEGDPWWHVVSVSSSFEKDIVSIPELLGWASVAAHAVVRSFPLTE